MLRRLPADTAAGTHLRRNHAIPLGIRDRGITRRPAGAGDTLNCRA